MKYIILVFILFVDVSFAQSPVKQPQQNYQKEVSRQKMLREAKFLQKRYDDALMKQQAWEERKAALTSAFNEKYRGEETAFGNGDQYGKERAKKRRNEFYASLNREERQIDQKISELEDQMMMLKEEFLFQFAVPLTQEEINGGPAPKIEEKDEKVHMLEKYINESRAWQKCREDVTEFDRVEQLAESLEKLFPENNLTARTILAKREAKEADMKQHLENREQIDQTFKTKYGLAIKDDKRAQTILKNIKESD